MTNPGPMETRTITVAMTDRAYAALIAKARQHGMTPTRYGQCLFEAAWAARCGKAEDDAILVACVDKSLARRSPAAASAPVQTITRAVAVPLMVPVVIPVPVPAPAIAEPVAVHISGDHPITDEAAGHIGALVAAAITKLDLYGEGAPPAPRPVPAPPTVRPARSARSQKWRILADLICREEGCSRTEATDALYPSYQDRKSLDVLVLDARRQLHAAGIEVFTIRGWGWRVPNQCRSAADAFLARDA